MCYYTTEDYYSDEGIDWEDSDVRRYYDGMARSRFIVDCFNEQRTGRWNGPTHGGEEDTEYYDGGDGEGGDG